MKRSAFLERLILKLPRPVARAAYAFAWRYVYQDPRRPYFEKAFQHIVSEGVPGDYLEFGVYRGTSFVACFKAARRYGLAKMRFFAFDSFEGLPSGEGRVFRRGDFKCTAETFLGIIHQAGVDTSRVRTIEGLYEESLTDDVKKRHDLRRAAVVHVDCDLYASAKSVLRFVEDLVDVGTVLIFDDWHSFHRHANSEEYGEQRAFEEWRLKDCFEPFYDSPRDGVMFCKAFVMVASPPTSASLR